MSQTGFYSNFSAALVEVGLKDWSSIFRPYVFFLPAYTACVRLLFCPGHYVFRSSNLNISKRVLFFGRCEIQDSGQEGCRLLGCDAVLSSINLLTFQSNLLLAIVRSLSYPEEGCSSFPKGR